MIKIIEVNDKKYEVLHTSIYYPDMTQEMVEHKGAWGYDELVIDSKNNLFLFCRVIEEAQIISETNNSI